MGSSESPPASWSPYEAYRDCSSGICSFYCPQWCYIVFSPPPQPSSRYDVSSSIPFPPVMIAVIVILACVFLVVSYYSFVYLYWRRRGSGNAQTDYGVHRDGVLPDEWQAAACGLEDFAIKSITVFKYRKSDGLVEGTECSVCLSDFEEGENLKLMPKCCHAFHPPCIDTWLKSQSSCPLCRARVNPFSHVEANSQSSVIVNVSSLEVQGDQNESVQVVVEDDSQVMEACVCDDQPKDPVRDVVEMENSEEESRGSISLGTFSCNLEGIGSSEDGVRRCYSNATFDYSLHDRA